MRARTFQIVLLLAAIIIAACAPQFIDQHDRIRVITDSDVHSGPGPQYKMIDTAKAGTELVLLGAENDWQYVRLPNGKTGWIFRGVTASIAPEKVVMSQDAKIRRGPGENYKAFAIAVKGKTLDARGQSGSWYLVDLPNGQSGWISKTEAQKVVNPNLTATQTTKIYQLPSSSSSALRTVSPGTELTQLQRQGDYYMVRLPNGDTGWIYKNSVNPAPQKTLTVKERADIKFGPSIQYDKVETVEKGTLLNQISLKDDWYEVRAPDGKTGWIYKDFITQPYVTSEGVTIPGVPLYYVTNTDCNIRQGDGTNYPILDRVKKGTILIKIGQKGNWYNVRLPDQRIGWIREDLADYSSTILVTLDNCNIRLGPSTDFRVKTTVPQGTPLVKIGEQKGWSLVNLPNGEAGWIRNDLRADSNQSLFVKEDCNVRDGPGTNYQQIDRLSAGTPLIKLNKKNDWYQVQLPSKQVGWIREDLLSDSRNQMVTNDQVNIRLGPGLNYQVITQLAKNSPINKIGEQDNWYQIKLTDGRTGWIRKDMVTFSYYSTSSYTPSVSSSYESSSVPTVQTPMSTTRIGSIEAAPPLTQSGARMTTTSAVNLRLGPSTDETIIKLLPAGTSVLRINKEGDWYEVQTDDGVLGFAHESGFSAGERKLYTNTKSNIRLGPSTDYQIVTTLPEKTELIKIEQRDNWINVQLPNGQKGWIRDDLVTGTSMVPPLLPQNAELVSGTLITTSDAKILEGPGDTYPAVKSVKLNTELKIVSKYKNWYDVETFDGEKGWIADQYVKKKDNKQIIVIRKSEVYQSSNTQSGVVTLVEVGNYFAPLNQELGWYRISVKPGVTGWIQAQNVLDLKYPPVYVNTPTADVMKFADDKSNRIAVIKEGVQLVPIDETDQWLFIELPRRDMGWIKKALVDRQKFPRIKIIRDTEAYEQPSAGSLTKATLIKGDSFLALDLRNNWYKILLRGSEIGWVYGGYVQEDTKGNLLVKENSFLRMGPGLDYRIITTVPGGQKTKWLDQKGDWSQVQLESGEVGWIFEQQAKNISMPEMTAQVNSTVFAGPGTNFAKVGEIIRGKKYASTNKTTDWYEIQLATGTTGWVPMDVFSPKKSRVVFTLDKANIRSGPGINYGIVQALEPAVDVTVLSTEGEWYYVQLQDGTRGYILKNLVFEE